MANIDDATSWERSPSPTRPYEETLFPNLRFETGDVVIWLDRYGYNCLVLHSDVLLAASPFFAGLRPEWANGKNKALEHPDLAQEVTVKTYGLKYIAEDRVMLLEKNGPQDFDNIAPIGRDITSFAESVYTDSDWASHVQDTRASGREVWLSRHAHRVLFCYWYELELPCETVSAYKGADMFRDYNSIAELALIVSEVGAYAEFYRCLPRVAPALRAVLREHPLLWRCVAKDTRQFLELGYKLHDAELFWDAWRHLLGSVPLVGNPFGIWEALGDRSGISAAEAQHLYTPQLQDLDATTAQLLTDVSKLQLHEYRYPRYGGMQSMLTTFLGSLRFKDAEKADRPQSVRNNEKQWFMARAIFGQWLSQHLYGMHLRVATREDAVPTGGFATVCNKLLDASQRDSPASILGPQVSTKYVEMFGASLGADAKRQLQVKLNKIIREAGSIVKLALGRREETDDNGTRVVYDRAHYDSPEHGVFTYLPVNEDEVPWLDEPAWETIKTIETPNMTKISDAWLKVLGLEVGVEDEAETTGDE